MVRKRIALQRDVQGARIVLAAGDGLDNVEIAEFVGVDVKAVSKWRKRFFEEGIRGGCRIVVVRFDPALFRLWRLPR